MASNPYKIPTSAFLSVAAFMFLLTFSAAYSVGFVPYYVDGSEPRQRFADAERAAPEAVAPHYDASSRVSLAHVPQLGEETAGVEPERIIIRSIGVDVAIRNPVKTEIEVLDEALLHGPVHYPTSAKLGENGNMFVFGHSSGLAVVNNQMFKVFNGLSELREGDTVQLQGGGRAYIYRVHTVRQADAEEEYVDISRDGAARLTLSTCNTFGKKSSRWIVEADMVGSFALN